MDFLEDIERKSEALPTATKQASAPIQRAPFNVAALFTGFIFVLFLIIVIGFSWQVFSYYQKLQKGAVVFAPGTYSSTVASTDRLEALVQGAPGSGALATTDDPHIGSPDAAITIVEFADFGCPYCAEERFVLDALVKKYPDDVRLIYRDFPLTDVHPGAELAAMAGECAQEQGKFWEFHEALFADQGVFTLDSLVVTAQEAGLRVSLYEQCMTSGIYEDEVMQDLADGVQAGVTGTPTFFINGLKVEGAIPYGVFDELIKAFLAQE
ncbi:DsbA family protein [Patescibacteria group bacterium]|nr:DsbA family protein [Patescibacteria group bacterium]